MAIQPKNSYFDTVFGVSMNLFKGIFYFVILIIGAVLLAALFAPSSETVKRSVIIDKDIKHVFNEVASVKRWSNWDPWHDLDTAQVRNFTGDLSAGSYGFDWISKKTDLGKGYIVFNEVVPNESISFDIKLLRFQGSGQIKFNTIKEGTHVEWYLDSELSYPKKLLNYFLNFEVGPQFEQGLAGLKTYLESEEIEEPTVFLPRVEIETIHGISHALIKVDDLPWANLDPYFKEVYKAIYGFVQTNGLAPKGPSRTFYFDWDTTNQTTTIAAAVPVSELAELDSAIAIELAIGNAELRNRSISYLMKGSYNQSDKVHNALRAWLQQENYSINWPILEEYLLGPNETADSTAYKTRIVYRYN